MEDIKYKKDKFNFVYRSSAIIYNKDKNKILLFYGNESDFYMLPGGKVKEMETSINAIQREVKEELNYENLSFEFVGVSEEIISNKNEDIHEITLTYKCIYDEEIPELPFKSLESDWINFKWVNINELKNYKIHPSNIIEMILNKKCHLIEKVNI